MAESTIKKLEGQLNCAICLETYKDPKLLQCFHIYCRDCLVKLVIRNQQGQLSLTCPTCRQATSIPANGVTGLQSAFQVNHLLEILEQHKKAKDAADSQEVVKTDVTHSFPSKKVIANCFEHKDTERQLYCETCEDLICFKCAIKGGKHHDHDHHLLDEAFERYKGEVAPSLDPMEGKLVAVKEALAVLDKRCGEISDQREVNETDIHDTFEQLQETLNIRKTKLISQLHQITQRKLKDLAVQRDQMETILAQLSSCLDFVRESLKTDSQGEVLMMKTNIMNRVKELTSSFQPDVLKTNEEADMKFSAPQDMIAKCQNYGQVFLPGSPDPSKCQATGRGLEVAVVGEKSTAFLQAIDFNGEPCMRAINSLKCELVSEITGATERGNVEHKGRDKYEISYQPTIKGKHQLSIKVEDTHLRGSPFAVSVKLPVEELGIPIQSIDGLIHPWGVAVNQREEVVISEEDKHCISIFSPSGEKRLTFGTRGFGQGQFCVPRGVAVDGEGNILVADRSNHRIQKFTANGQFLSAVGTKGEGPLQFCFPSDIAYNPTNNKVYVADSNNHRVQVLNSDLNFSSSFGKNGNGKGQFDVVRGIACDSTGKVYVADIGNHRIQVFTAIKGQFCKMFGKLGTGLGALYHPCGIAIDRDDIVYVCEKSNNRISIFTSKGQFVRLFGSEFKSPRGVAVDSSGVVYVCDRSNNRVQVF